METQNKKTILFLGPLPPPYMGPSEATKIILNSILNLKFNLIHLDTTDRRDLNTLGKFDFQNIYLAFKHYLCLLWLICSCWPEVVYIPISQTTIGYLRDSGFILIAKLFRRKVICHLRGGNFKNWYFSAHPLTRNYVRFIHSFIDAQIVLGERLKSLFDGLVPEEKIFVVPNGKDIHINFENEKNIDKVIILFLSNFIPEKGILDLLGSVPIVYRKHSGAKFIFAGNWRDKGTKRRFESFLKHNPNLPIDIKGPVYGQRKYELYVDADIFVLPSYYPAEGHPWVIVEAMASGLPIISTDQGAIKESVRDGENGFIVDKHSPIQIADKINYLIENPQIRKNMGAESYRLYLDHFTEDKMVQRLGEAFNHVIS